MRQLSYNFWRIRWFFEIFLNTYFILLYLLQLHGVFVAILVITDMHIINKTVFEISLGLVQSIENLWYIL